MNRSKGFTLIELLVVIAIIGLLASIILASLNTAQQKGRDARRISDLKEIQLALELYYDSNSSYPVSTAVVSATPSASDIPASLIPTYLSTTPTDPSQPASGASAFYYQYESLNSDNTQCTTVGTCQAYVLVTHLEAVANSSTWAGTLNSSDSTTCPTGGGSVSPFAYCVRS